MWPSIVNELVRSIPQTLFGMNVRTSPLIQPVPKIQLSRDFNCSEEFRENTNAWLLDMFGTKEVAYAFGNDLILTSDMLLNLTRSVLKGEFDGR